MKQLILIAMATVAFAGSGILNETYAADAIQPTAASQPSNVANSPIANDRHFQVLYKNHHGHHWYVYRVFESYNQASHVARDLRHRGYDVRIRSI